jgi:hypothetical protein
MELDSPGAPGYEVDDDDDDDNNDDDNDDDDEFLEFSSFEEFGDEMSDLM